MPAPLRAVYLVFASLTLEVLAFLLSLHNRHQPMSHRGAVVTLVVGAVVLAWASVWRAPPGRTRRTKHTSVRLLRRSH